MLLLRVITIDKNNSSIVSEIADNSQKLESSISIEIFGVKGILEARVDLLKQLETKQSDNPLQLVSSSIYITILF